MLEISCFPLEVLLYNRAIGLINRHIFAFQPDALAVALGLKMPLAHGSADNFPGAGYFKSGSYAFFGHVR